MTNNMVDYAGYLGDELHGEPDDEPWEAWHDGSEIGCKGRCDYGKRTEM